MEILVTLAIVSLFSTAVYAVFLQSIVDTRWVRDRTLASRSGHAILRMLERDLVSCLPADETAPHFVGEEAGAGESRLELLSATDARGGAEGRPSDLVRVEYFTTSAGESADGSGGDQKWLYRRETAEADGLVEGEGELVLLDRGVRSFALEFLGEAGWTSAWDDLVPPRAVRVELLLARDLREGVRGPAREVEIPFRTIVRIPVGDLVEELATEEAAGGGAGDRWRGEAEGEGGEEGDGPPRGREARDGGARDGGTRDGGAGRGREDGTRGAREGRGRSSGGSR